MATYNQEIKNMKLISHHDLNGFGNAGEGVALQKLPDGRRIFWIAHESAPKDVTALDVSDLANPKIVLQTDLPYPYLRSNSLAVLGDLLLVAYQANKPGLPGVGMGIYDISNPTEPKRIAFLDTSGSLLPRRPLSLVCRRRVRPSIYRRGGFPAASPVGRSILHDRGHENPHATNGGGALVDSRHPRRGRRSPARAPSALRQWPSRPQHQCLPRAPRPRLCGLA